MAVDGALTRRVVALPGVTVSELLVPSLRMSGLMSSAVMLWRPEVLSWTLNCWTPPVAAFAGRTAFASVLVRWIVWSSMSTRFQSSSVARTVTVRVSPA